MKKLLILSFLAVTTFAADTIIRTDKIKFGKGANAVNKILEADSGLGANNPKMKLDVATGRWQFSNDGTNFTDVGAGGSGSAGVNLLADNPDFETGNTNFWSNSGGTFAATSTAANVGFGTYAGSFTASAGSQHVKTDDYAIPSGLQGRNCLARIHYKGGSSNLTLQAIDGSANVLAAQTLGASTGYTTQSVSFVCPSSGDIALRILSSASSAVIYLDNAHVGENFLLGEVSQATQYGTLSYAGTALCTWSVTGNDTFGSFPADTDCPSAVVSGEATAPGTKIPGITFTNMPPGKYRVVAVGSLYDSVSNSVPCAFRFTDGTNHTSPGLINASGTTSTHPVIEGDFTYTTAANRTIELQATGSNGSETCQILNEIPASRALKISVYRFPTSTELAFRPEQINWKVDANISGANVDLGTSNQTSYVEMTNASLTLTNNSGNGNIAAQIPCSGTNPPTGTTCSAGSESVGVSFNLPVAGDVLACASFSSRLNPGDGGTIDTAYQIVETPSNAQTISQEGKTRIDHSGTGQGGGGVNDNTPTRLCGNFSFASAGTKTLRLMYEQFASGPISAATLVMADASASIGQRDIHWEVYPVNNTGPAPVFVGSMTNDENSAMKIIRGTVTPDVAVCTINEGSGFTTTDGAAGTCTVNFTTAFSGVPSCTFSLSGNTGVCAGNGVTASSAGLIARNSGFTATDALACGFICVGPK